MAQGEGEATARIMNRAELELALLSNSTKRRISTLHTIERRIEEDEFSVPNLRLVSGAIFETYPLYIDRNSRKAAEQCLRKLVANPKSLEVLQPLFDLIHVEVNKNSVAPANSFVLTEWCCVFLEQLTATSDLWKKWGLSMIDALAITLEKSVGSTHRDSIKHSAIISARRALRRIFKNENLGSDALPSIVAALTTKRSSPTARNAVLLGVMAGVSARLPEVKDAFVNTKKDCYAFYTREIIGSRTVLAQHISNGLQDLFQSFTDMDDLQREILPAIEKALLRAPEVVLCDLVTPLILSLRQDLDLSDILQKHLMKPLMSNIKTSNPTVRAGVLRTFDAIASRSAKEGVLDKIAEEILNPLKQNKVPAVEQRVIHAQMLSSIAGSEATARRVPPGIVTVALKEANETAIEAETLAMTKHMLFGFEHSIPHDNTTQEAFSKGLADKRPTVRRIWALRAGDLLWSLTPDHFKRPEVLSFTTTVLGKMADIFKEVIANPLPSAQNGLATVAFVFTALSAGKLSGVEDAKVREIIRKASVLNQVLVVESKPSFLLNPRVFSKISLPEDLGWVTRALISVSETLASKSSSAAVELAWSQAILYFVTAASIPYKVRLEAAQQLTEAYCSSPAYISSIIVSGLWEWRRSVDVNDKESVAIAAKSDISQLGAVLRCICLSPKDLEKVGASIDPSILDEELIQLLILTRPELLPGVSWIETCLRVSVDPGKLAECNAERCLNEIIATTEKHSGESSSPISLAAYRAAADLAFVAPVTAIPLLVMQMRTDLDPAQLINIGATESSIFRTPEGIPYIDVLASKNQQTSVDKKAKDYDTLKWEEELRAHLASKSKQTRKLTPDEQAKVKAQLAKESEIRQQVGQVSARLRRGVGFIQALSTGPPTEAELWIVQAVDMLHEIIEAGAGLILGETATTAYLDCAQSVTNRLGPLRQFIGVATLRAMGVSQLAPELLGESLPELVTRVLYRLRFMGEQRPFDVVSLAYILPLIFLVLQSGGFAAAGSEEADEQLMLALEFVSFHTDAFANTRLPRRKLLTALISTMQRFNQHYKIIKDSLQNLVNSMEPNITSEETSVLLKGTIVPQVSVRTAVLQAIDASLDFSDMDYCEEIWIECHDIVAENSELATTIWEESDLNDPPESAISVLLYIESQDRQLRRAAASACSDTVQDNPKIFVKVLSKLKELYTEKAKPRVPEKDAFGLPRRTDLADMWEARSGVALTFKALADVFQDDEIVAFLRFMIERGPLGDQNATVRDEMIDAATTVIAQSASKKVEELMEIFEAALEGPDRGSETYDKVNEAVIILYGALARHLKSGDKRVPKVVQRLLDTLSTPSETVQFAVAECLPPLVQASLDKTPEYVQDMMDKLLQSKQYAARRGAAYGLAGIVRGQGISALREYRIMSTLKGATEAKKDQNQRQGAVLAYELLSLILGRLFEPYVIQIVPQLLAGFGDPTADVREACLDAAKACFATLSSFGVKQTLPTLLEGLDEDQWRSKKGACDSLGAMAYLDPQQLALSLPEIIPPLTNVLNDSHKEVRGAANRSLQRFGEVISNPEIKSVVSILLKALSDPTKYTNDALDALIKIQFVHYLDAPSLALVVRILERGLGDRSATKRKAAQIIGSLAHLTDRKDLIAHLPILVAGLRVAIVDPVPTTRATASKALGSLIEKLGEEALPDLIPSLMATLKSDTGAGDRLGSAQALSEVLAGLGTSRLEETLPSILQNVASSKPSVREGFMSLFIFLPACFGTSFSNYLSKIIPPILAGLADEIESIRETALRAGRLLVKNFATRAIDLLLPELERGLADDNYRIRLSSVELVGDLLFNLTGITVKTDEEEPEEVATEAGQSLLDVLGEERRDRVLSALYICRCDTSGLVRSAAINVWKALVATPRTLREITPTLTQLIIRRLASSNMEQKVIAGNALGELIRKAGEGVLATLLPTLEEGLNSTDAESRQGICMALRDVIASASADALEDYEKLLISVVRTALVDSDADVREAAAEAFDSLQQMLGKKAVDQVLPYLLSLLRSDDNAENALAALLTLLTDATRSNIILPNLLPTLLTSPISSFNAKAIASLSEVASSAMTRRLPHIINGLVDNIIVCKDSQLLEDLSTALDSVLLSVDEYDGLNTAMSVILTLVKHDDHRKRRTIDVHLATFLSDSEIDISRYYPDLIRSLLISFDDRDDEVIKAAWNALNELTKRLRKEEMEALVISTRQVLQQVGVAGANLPGFQLPKGINAILPIFLQGLMYGTAEQRTQAALAISDIVDRASPDALKPFVTQITGPLIRVVSERSVEVKAAILLTLNHLLEKIPTFLKPFLPQLQRTFAKSLADTSSEVLRIRAAKALGTLITMTPRIDPLIAELVTGSKTPDAGVKNAMMKALYEVVSKAGANMSEVSRNSILGVIDADSNDNDDAMAMTNSRLLGALIKVLPADKAESLIKNRVLTTHFTKPSILALNAVLVESPESITGPFADETPAVICEGIKDNQTFVAENAVLAAGKYLLTPSSGKSFETCRHIFELLASVIPPGKPVDIRRLALVVVRTISREHNDLVRPHINLLVPQIFASVRDMVIPVKLAAEAAFLAIFSVVDEESTVFDKYLAGPGAALPPTTKRSLTDYFRRVVVRLAAQARERKEAEGGAGGLGLSSDEVEDEKELWSVGKMDLGEGSFSVD